MLNGAEMMRAELFCSKQTDVTDDELLLMDFLAVLGPAPLGMLRRDDYVMHMNLETTHDISDSGLSLVLDQMKTKGWVTLESEDEPGKDRYALTPKGGLLWETERRPIWTRYSTALLGETAGRNYCRVTAYDRQTGEQFIRTADALGYSFHLLPDHQTRWEQISEPGIRYWDCLDRAWMCDFDIVRTDDSVWEDWGELERRRTWWDQLNELQKFLPHQKA